MTNNNANCDLVISFSPSKSNSSAFNGSFSSQISSTTSTLSVLTNSTLVSSTRTSNSNSKPFRKKVSDLRCSEIRWFYKKENDSKWTSFTGYDSTILEFAFRKKFEIKFDEGMETILAELPQTEQVILFNGLYKLDEKENNKILPIYWKDESIEIRRGLWFYTENMQPLAMDLADAIEKQHLIGFSGQIIPDSPVFSEAESSKKPVLISLKWNDNEEIRWNSVIDVSISNLKKGNRLIRFVTRSRTMSLKRGYSEETSFYQGKPNLSDLILVIHGIGQKGYENLIAKNTSQIRDGINQLIDKYYPNEDRRPIILPIEWRSSLTLDNNLTDVITLPRMPSMRNTLNSVAMDIMYYQSPLYRTEIVNGVIRTLNNVYTTFKNNNPNFNGSVSIYAHSLGSVIAYDILTNWSPFNLYDEFITGAIEEFITKFDSNKEDKSVLKDFYNSRKKLLDGNFAFQKILSKTDEEIKFRVKNLFCVGSPLAVFIIMRGADRCSVIPTKDKVERIYNIFHPYDPVAYRLEPLFHENYRYIRPLKLFSYNDSKHSYSNILFECHKSYLKRKKKERANGKNELEKSVANDKDDSDSGDCSTPCSSPRSQSPVFCIVPPPHPPPPNFDNNLKTINSAVKKTITPDPLLVGEAGELLEEIPTNKRVPLRIDYQIQPALTDKSYWSVIKSHFNYWTNLDVTAFLLNELYPQPDQTVAAVAFSATD